MSTDLTQHISADVVRAIPEGVSDYELALHMAGVDVVAHERFGSYSGEWLAIIRAPNGAVGLIRDWFGSCSVCDSFEAEFGWGDDKNLDYAHKLRDFGRKYLEDVLSRAEALKVAAESTSYDITADEMVKWINDNWPTEALYGDA